MYPRSPLLTIAMLAAIPPSLALAAPSPKLQETEYVQALRSELSRYPRVRPALAAKLILVESRGQLDVPDGAAGEIGAMQIRPQTFAYVSRNILKKRDGELDPRHPHHNLAVGVALLNWLLDRYDQNESLALIGYNAGIGTADRARQTMLEGKTARIPKTTVAYIRTILGTQQAPGPQTLVALAQPQRIRVNPRSFAAKALGRQRLQQEASFGSSLHTDPIDTVSGFPTWARSVGHAGQGDLRLSAEPQPLPGRYPIRPAWPT